MTNGKRAIIHLGIFVVWLYVVWKTSNHSSTPVDGIWESSWLIENH